jgi:hypothetical protein
MRAVFLLPLVTGILFSAANARTAPDQSSACKTAWDSMASADKSKTNYGDYLKTCQVSGPTAAPAAATVSVPDSQMSKSQKKAACERKWTAAQKITPTGSQTMHDFVAHCMQSR